MRRQREILNALGRVFRHARRAKVLGLSLRVFVRVIVETVERMDLDDGQNLVAQHADRQFLAANRIAPRGLRNRT